MHERTPTAIDPLALVLSNAAYVRLTLPDPDPEEIRAQVKQVAQSWNPAERRVFLENVRTLGTFVEAIEAELQRGAEVERPQVQAR